MATTRRAPGGRTRQRLLVRAAGVAAVVVMASTACGGGSSKPASSTSSTSTTAPPTATSSSSPAPTTPSATAGGPADAAAAEAQIKQNWQTFFDPKTKIADKEKYLENGTVLAPLLQGFAADPRVGQVSAAVTNVAFTSATTATVTYSLSLQGTVVVPNATGKAVLQDGTWKVADSTLCGLVALTGNTKLPGCS